MTQLWKILAVVAIAAAPVAAHEGHAHRYMGTITTVAPKQLQLKTTSGQTVTFKLDETTRISRGRAKASKEDLKPGVRAVVEADGGAQPATAKTIKLPSGDAKTS